MIDPFEFTKPQKKKNHLSLITWLLESVSQSAIHLSGVSTSFVCLGYKSAKDLGILK